MSDFIDFSNSGNNYIVSCNRPDFDTSDFYTELGGYGQIKRITINLVDLNTGITYPFVSSNFEILRNKMNSKISKLIKDRIKGQGIEEAEKMNEDAYKVNAFLKNPLKYQSPQCKTHELEYFLQEDIFKKRNQSNICQKVLEIPQRNQIKHFISQKLTAFIFCLE